jgi:hypothetical protein
MPPGQGAHLRYVKGVTLEARTAPAAVAVSFFDSLVESGNAAWTDCGAAPGQRRFLARWP